MSLQIFISTHREELIKRTRAKVAARASPPQTENDFEQGVPAFLSQLANALGDQEEDDNPAVSPHGKPGQKENASIANSSRLHGLDLKRLGFTIDQVVHDYGDVCQAVTELTLEKRAVITTSEFRTLNRCLDNAIAGAVTSWNEESQRKEGDSRTLVDVLATKLDTAIAAFSAFRSGHVSSAGATATVLARCLIEMRVLLHESAAKT
jgi:hypothetical protein